jgi:hypothetical protein
MTRSWRWRDGYIDEMVTVMAHLVAPGVTTSSFW